jgi:hypothetical protein
MSDLLMIAPFVAPAVAALGYLVRQHHHGRAKRREVELDGWARLIRAQRGDAEPPKIHVIQAEATRGARPSEHGEL